jgi:hypothetical protein
MKINQITNVKPQICEASLSTAIRGNVEKFKNKLGDKLGIGKIPMAQEKQPTTTLPTTVADPTVDAQAQKFIQQLVASYQALTPAEQVTLKKELQDAVIASEVGGNVVKGTMESRRSKKRVR